MNWSQYVDLPHHLHERFRERRIRLTYEQAWHILQHNYARGIIDPANLQQASYDSASNPETEANADPGTSQVSPIRSSPTITG